MEGDGGDKEEPKPRRLTASVFRRGGPKREAAGLPTVVAAAPADAAGPCAGGGDDAEGGPPPAKLEELHRAWSAHRERRARCPLRCAPLLPLDPFSPPHHSLPPFNPLPPAIAAS